MELGNPLVAWKRLGDFFCFDLEEDDYISGW